jgi:hypothetical protein
MQVSRWCLPTVIGGQANQCVGGGAGAGGCLALVIPGQTERAAIGVNPESRYVHHLSPPHERGDEHIEVHRHSKWSG